VLARTGADKQDVHDGLFGVTLKLLIPTRR
jgi:hypothetical protein